MAADRRTALVADDSAAVRRLVSETLTHDGWDVREADGGFTAWELIQEQPPDLLVVDDVLPSLSGVELVELLRARDDLRATRVAFLVEYRSGVLRAELVGLAENVVRKPFDLDELAARLRAAAA
jgi:two-component system OmpR family response regulator